MTADKSLIKFIKEARNRGFDDYQIREPLLKRGWPKEIVEDSFIASNPEAKTKEFINETLGEDKFRKSSSESSGGTTRALRASKTTQYCFMVQKSSRDGWNVSIETRSF